MSDTCELAVNGTLMRGLELNDNLQQVSAVFGCEIATAPIYRLWSIFDRHPAMIRVSTGLGSACGFGNMETYVTCKISQII